MTSILHGLSLAPSLRSYRAAWLRSDFSAGLAIAAVGLPSAIAYPAIAGLPPVMGLYASMAPLVAYAIFGPSRQLIVGPDAPTMTVLAAVLAALLLDMPSGTDRTGVVAVLTLVVGAFYLLASLLRLGVLANFLSRPILTGFFAGVSVSILIGQIGRMTGLSIEADGLVGPLAELVREAGSIHLPTAALAAAMFVLLQVLRMTRFPVPGPVVVVVVSVALSALFDFEGRGIAVVGDIPVGLPTLTMPQLAGLPVDTILLGAAAIFLVSFGSGIVTARSFGAQAGYAVDANRELTGFGAANIAAGLFGAFPVTASDSRTAVNLSVGGRTQVAGLVAAATVMATLLYLGPALRVLPIPALGAILAATAINLIDLATLRRIWRISPSEFVFALIAMWGPISLGVLNGVVIAIGATLAYLLLKQMHPRDAMLGLIPGRQGFYKLHRSPEARPEPGLALCLIQGSVLFFNADNVRARLNAIADELPPDTRWFVLDASAIVQLDSTGAAILQEVAADLAARGISLGVAELHGEPKALLERVGLVEQIGPAMIFDDLKDALRVFRAAGDGHTSEAQGNT